MAKKRSSQPDIQGLTIFQHKERPGKIKTNKYLVSKTNKEDKITVTNSLTPQGMYFRYSIIISNEKSESISDLNITIFTPIILEIKESYPQKLKIASTSKDNQDKSNIINLELKILRGKSSEKIYFHFKSSGKLGNGEFVSILKYTDHNGKEKEIKSQSMKIHLEDLKILPKIISHLRIREITQIPGMKRTLISLGIGTTKKLNSKKIFETIEQIFVSYNFQFITKDKEKGILWIYGSESNSNHDILALSKIGINIIEIIAYSTNFIILSQFLCSLNNKIRSLLLTKKLIKPSTIIYELECDNCGESLPYFPKVGESIICIKCSHEQFIW